MPGRARVPWGTMTKRHEDDDDDDLIVEDRDDEDGPEDAEDDDADSAEADEVDEDSEDQDDDEDPDKEPPKQTRLTPAQIAKKARETNKRVHQLLQDRWQLATRLEQTEAENARLRGETVHSGVAGAEAELNGIEKDLSQAVEDGDTKSVVELQRRHSQAVYRLEQRRAEQEKYPKSDDKDAGQQQQGQGQRQQFQPHPRVLEWGDRVGVQNWTEQERYLAHVVDQQLIADGYSPDDDDFWVEADERLTMLVPTRMAKAKKFVPGQQRSQPPGRRSRPPMTPTRGGKPQAHSKSLTKEEQKVMREAGYDPANEAHKKLFLKYGRE